MERIKVAVSPFYGGEDWTDEATNITFSVNPRGLNVYSIPANLDLSGIRRAIRLNSLILVEGNVGDFNEVEEIVVEEPVTEAPKEEVKAEEPIIDVEIGIKEAAVEEAAEAKKPARRKTAPKKESTDK